MSPIERLIELLIKAWDRLLPWMIVHVYQGAVVLRLGNYHRTLGPGFHWKIPLFEEGIESTTVVTTLRLPPQTLTTSDQVGVAVAAIVKYQIRDLRSFVTEIWDQHDVLADVSMGAIRTAVHGRTYEQLIQEPPERDIVESVRRQVNRYGFKIETITFTDIGRVYSIRLMTPHGTSLEN